MIATLMSDASIPINIYKLDRSHFDGEGFSDTVGQMLLKTKGSGHFLNEQAIVGEIPDEFTIRLFAATKVFIPKWISFLKPILRPESALFTTNNITQVFVCFIGYGEEIYIITGGPVSAAIERYVDHNFGLEIIMRLFEKNDKVLRSIQNWGVTGSVLGQTKFYRGDQRFSDEDRFGKIFKQVNAELTKGKLMSEFGFDDKDIKRKTSGCLAKASFQLTKSIDFPQLLRVIKKLSGILERDRKFSLNKVHLISRRHFKKRTEDLDKAFLQELFDKWKRGETLDVDFCHNKFAEYLTASRYVVMQSGKEQISDDEKTSLADLIRRLKAKNSFDDRDIDYFKISMQLNIMYTYGDEPNPLTWDSLWDHVHGELTHEDRTYFKVDGEWYEIHADFIEDLNKECADVISQCWEDKLISFPFDCKTEGEYNHKFLRESGCIVLDTVTPENIEACDVVIYNKHLVHLVHVKQGFDNSIRDLTSQISIAAKRIKADIKSNFSYIGKLQDTVKKGTGAAGSHSAKLAAQTFPPDGLKGIFSGKKNDNQIIFCFAFVDTAKSKRCSINDDITKYNSNIAKFSLLELRREIIGLGFGFKIIQLQKP